MVGCVKEEADDATLNFFRCEPFRKQMQRHQERRIGIPIREMKRNIFGVYHLRYATQGCLDQLDYIRAMYPKLGRSLGTEPSKHAANFGSKLVAHMPAG